jgi:stress-induced-phosphoprotein 1
VSRGASGSQGARFDESPPASPPPHFKTTPTSPSQAPRSTHASTSTAKGADAELADSIEEDEDEEKIVKKSALHEKELGNAAYKKRELDVAEAHFSKAWELWPQDMTFLTNLAGGCFCPE